MPCYSIPQMLDMATKAGYQGAGRIEVVAHALVESSGCSDAYNPSGAAGILQFLPGTAAQYGLNDPYDAQASFNASYRASSGGTNFSAWTPYEPAAALDGAREKVRSAMGGTGTQPPSSGDQKDPTGIGAAISSSAGYLLGQARATGSHASAGLQLGTGLLVLGAGLAVVVWLFLQRTETGRGLKRAGAQLTRTAVVLAK